MEKTTNFEPSCDANVMNKTYLDKNLSRLEGRISYIEKAYNVFKLFGNKDAKHPLNLERSNKNSVEEVLFE